MCCYGPNCRVFCGRPLSPLSGNLFFGTASGSSTFLFNFGVTLPVFEYSFAAPQHHTIHGFAGHMRHTSYGAPQTEKHMHCKLPQHQPNWPRSMVHVYIPPMSHKIYTPHAKSQNLRIHTPHYAHPTSQSIYNPCPTMPPSHSPQPTSHIVCIAHPGMQKHLHPTADIIKHWSHSRKTNDATKKTKTSPPWHPKTCFHQHQQKKIPKKSTDPRVQGGKTRENKQKKQKKRRLAFIWCLVPHPMGSCLHGILLAGHFPNHSFFFFWKYKSTVHTLSKSGRASPLYIGNQTHALRGARGGRHASWVGCKGR